MARVDLPERHAVAQARRAVRDSLMSHGEEAVLVSVRHANADAGEARCPGCWDDIYKQGRMPDCSRCFGTTFADPIKSAARVWAVFTDTSQNESVGPRGVWSGDDRGFQTEPFPGVIEHDFVVRVRNWSPAKVALSLEGVYIIQEVYQDSLRTGSQYGQSELDVVGQRANVTRLHELTGIYQFPVVGKQFDRLNGLQR